ncbi:MAG: SIMPL domain-containing protein [Candidatus Buchananbacteria bacterium]|nr:SIMPL domain-containing protein [Candidatus Buchananbacteria bacterium]
MANEYNSKQKLALLLVGMILLTGVISLALLRDRIVNWPQWTVTVTGQGKVSYQPDTAVVYLGVRVEKAISAERALTQVNNSIDKVLTAVKELNIPEADIQTQNYSLYPQYDYIDGVSVLSGYTASEQLVVKVRNLKDQPNLVADLVAKATAAGANQVDGISFEASDIEVLKQQARLMAIQDAKNRAGALATAADVKLGKVVGWWDNVVQGPITGQPYYYDGKGGMGAGGAVGQVPNGQQEIIIEVGVNYRVK